MEKKVDELREALLAELGDFTEYEGEFRFSECPLNDCYHPNSPSFVVNKETGCCHCHDCGESTHIKKLIPELKDYKFQKIEVATKASYDDKANSYYQSLESAKPNSLTDQYLQSRGINLIHWKDFELPLREVIGSEINKIAIYPFINEAKEIVATQTVLINGQNFQDKERRYFGPKGQGVAILKDSDKIIVAEGLETGLSVRQYLGNEYGLIICGDAGNLSKLSVEHSWALKNRTQIIIAADNDINCTGIQAARTVYFKFLQKSLLYMPHQPGTDWNDVLLNNKFKEEWL